MTKITAILGGCDWYDASVHHLVIPDDMNLDQQKADLKKWYKEVYYPSFHQEKREKYYTFVEWLIKNGARYTTEDELVEYDED